MKLNATKVSSGISPELRLRRAVMSCLLWESNFYEDGMSIADRIDCLCDRVSPETIAEVAIEARRDHHLRHVPLLLLCGLARRGSGRIVSDTVAEVISRADELAELLAIYWRNGRAPLSNPLRRGLAKAFTKFNEYELAKYAGKTKAISLRDVMFLCHPKPKSESQARVFMELANNTLRSPDTWEVSLSAGGDKKETFERLIREQKLGYLALLRNLRNMRDAGCDMQLVEAAILLRRGAEKVLPFRFVAAARAVPSLEQSLDIAMSASINALPRLSGKTIVLVDVSGSMWSLLSLRSDLSRMDAAASLASVVNAEDLRVFSFSDDVVEVPPRRGMAGVDAIIGSQSHCGTKLGHAVSRINAMPHDRLIVISDEQSHDIVPSPAASRAYMINVSTDRNGVGYGGGWTHIDGFSEHVIRFISEIERCE